MIKAVKLAENNIQFAGQKKSDKPQKIDEESTLLPNTLKTRILQKYDKTTSAFTEYPKKGLLGDVNSDFYEFLAMGIVPYLAGSAMFMTMFNLVTKHLNLKSQKFAGLNGKKMALGVIMYGLFKTLSNDLVTRPVYWGTGVDLEMPYRHISYPLPKEKGENANIYPMRQHRKVYDSREFFRKDLIQKDLGVKYYDGIAKKLDLGENLNDSVTETTPIIQSIVSTTKTAKSLSSYTWAAVGVGLAVQNSWGDFFDAISNRKRHIPKPNESFLSKMGSRMKNAGTNFVNINKTMGKSFIKAWKTLWTGEAGTKSYMKHAGKGLILSALAITAGTTANAIYRAKHMGKLVNKDLMDKNKESTVI